MIVNSYKKLLDKFSMLLILQLLIFINYFFWFFETNEILRLTIIYLIFLSSFFLLFKLFKDSKFLFFLIIFFIIITLGSPSFHWDARAIWLFHAKKLFFDKNLSYIINDYGNFYFNAYPILGPSFAASIAEFFGFWNEVFPKLFNILLALPVLFYLNHFLINKSSKIIFIFLILFIFEKSLIMGEMDGLVALYFVNCTLILLQLFYQKNFAVKNKYINNFFNNKMIFTLFAILNFSILTLLKKESFIYFLILFFSIYFSKALISGKYNVNKNIMFIFFTSILSLALWEYFIIMNNISLKIHPGTVNFFQENSAKILFFKILHLKNYFIISKAIFLNKSFVISIIFSIFFTSFFVLSDKNYLKKCKFMFVALFLITGVYLAFVFFIYLITSWNLEWHLYTSAGRVMLPLTFLFSFISLLISQKNFDKKNKLFIK